MIVPPPSDILVAFTNAILLMNSSRIAKKDNVS